MQHTLRVIEAARPPFRHQTNAAYTPMAALKHADPSGALMTEAFYKLVFKYGAVLRFGLRERLGGLRVRLRLRLVL